MSFWVYILRCADSSYYTGHTDNLEKRIHEHHLGAITSCYTFKRRPLQLAFSQDFPTRIEALTSERQIKGWSRKKKEAMMRGDWAEVSRLAKSSNTCRADNTVQAESLYDDSHESSDAVRPETSNTVHQEPFYAVRPEPGACRTVEGTNKAQDKPIEGNEPSIHPSTVRPFDKLTAHSSGRTDGERSL